MLELKRIYWSRLALRLAYLAVTVWLFAALIMSFTTYSENIAGRRPTTGTAISADIFDGVLVAVAAPGLAIVVLILVASVMRARDIRRRDRVRRFSRQQRRDGMARAGVQCEMEAGFGRRCSRPAEHGDHFYPWSKGGSTSLQNFVAACSRCNRAKGARIPSPGEQARLERRRRMYVPSDASVSAGERQPLP